MLNPKATRGRIRKIITMPDGSQVAEKEYTWPGSAFKRADCKGEFLGADGATEADLGMDVTCQGLLVSASVNEHSCAAMNAIDPGLGDLCKEDYDAGIGCYGSAGSALRLLALHSMTYGLYPALIRIGELRTADQVKRLVDAWTNHRDELAEALLPTWTETDKEKLRWSAKKLREFGLPYAPAKKKDAPQELLNLRAQIRRTTASLSGG